MIKKIKQRGLALITILVFGALAMIVIIFGVTLMVIQTDSARQFLAAQKTLAIAESGMENALLRLLRNPNYSGETLTFPNGTATIVVTSEMGSKIVTVTADSENFLDSIRTIQAVISEQDGQSIISSWQEL